MPVSSGPAAANLERLTDKSLYTGSHKEKFDEEANRRIDERGQGIEDLRDKFDTSGRNSGRKENARNDKASIKQTYDVSVCFLKYYFSKMVDSR